MKSFSAVSPQFRRWTELLLTQLCLLCNLSASTGLSLEPQKALRVFRFWDKLTEVKPGQSQSSLGSPNLSNGVLRRSVWKAYYDTLSAILREGYRYSTNSEHLDPELYDQSDQLPEAVSLRSRLQQRAEIQRVETIYERLLLNETKFPKAKESNKEVELWIEGVIGNWRVLCGSDWQDDELGEGGKSGVGRGVLDVRQTRDLYYVFTNLLRRYFIERQQRHSTPPRFYGIYSQFMHHWLNSISHLRLLILMLTWFRKPKIEPKKAGRKRPVSMMTTQLSGLQQRL